MKDRIKTIRRHYALTQAQFAKKIGKTSGFISNIENGRCSLSDSTIRSVCSAFGVNEQWLRDGSGAMFIEGKENAAADKAGIGSRVREVRNRAGLTQAEFGKQVGFHRNQVCNIETGKSVPSEAFLAAVSRQFKVGIDWLVTGQGESKDPVDDRLIDWLRKNPELARELRIRGGLD
mgnify:CR=1 FL=1